LALADPDLSSPPPSRGIWFGDHPFSEPEPLPYFLPAGNSGVFAILVDDPACHPRSLRAIYFGESENIPADLTPWHDKYESWCRISGGAMNLRVSFLWLDSSTLEERHAIASALIAQYHPECN